jgi:hypothetical protein
VMESENPYTETESLTWTWCPSLVSISSCLALRPSLPVDLSSTALFPSRNSPNR